METNIQKKLLRYKPTRRMASMFQTLEQEDDRERSDSQFG